MDCGVSPALSGGRDTLRNVRIDGSGPQTVARRSQTRCLRIVCLWSFHVATVGVWHHALRVSLPEDAGSHASVEFCVAARFFLG